MDIQEASRHLAETWQAEKQAGGRPRTTHTHTTVDGTTITIMIRPERKPQPDPIADINRELFGI